MPYPSGDFGFPDPRNWGKPSVPKGLKDFFNSSAPGNGFNNLADLVDMLKSKAGGGGEPYKWQSGLPGGDKNNTASLLEGALMGAGMGASQGRPKQTARGPSADQELLAQLDALMNQGGMIGDPGQLQAALSEAAGGIKKAFGAQIGSIRNQNQGARADTAEGSKEIRAMYNALAKDYRKGAKLEAKGGKKFGKTLAGMGAKQAKDIGAGTSRIMEENSALSAGLEAPDLAQELNTSVADQGQRLQGNAINAANREGRAAAGQSNIERRYLNTMAPNTNLEGTNRAADLYSQLQDYLQNNRDKISELAGARAAALAQSKASIQGSYSSQQSDALQDMINNKMALAQLRMQMQDSKWDRKMDVAGLAQAGAGEQDDPYAGLADQSAGPMALLGNYMASGGANAKQVGNLYNDFSDNNSMKLGYYDDDGNANKPVSLQDNYAGMMDYVKERLGPKWNQLDAGQRSVLINALLLQLKGGSFKLPGV